jgi:hypothetical protein
MRKDDMDWKALAAQLLWFNIVYRKNEYSGYDVVLDSSPREILRDTSFLSYSVGPVKKLTWKELALELGLFEDILTPDGHDCKNCPQRKDCLAYFKDDPDQERCSWWMDHMLDKEE